MASALKDLIRGLHNHLKRHGSATEPDEAGCRQALDVIKRQLPQLLELLNADAGPSKHHDVVHVCRVMKMLLSGQGCPLSIEYLFSKDPAAASLPLLTKLLVRVFPLLNEPGYPGHAEAYDIACFIAKRLGEFRLDAFCAYYADVTLLLLDSNAVSVLGSDTGANVVAFTQLCALAQVPPCSLTIRSASRLVLQTWALKVLVNILQNDGMLVSGSSTTKFVWGLVQVLLDTITPQSPEEFVFAVLQVARHLFDCQFMSSTGDARLVRQLLAFLRATTSTSMSSVSTCAARSERVDTHIAALLDVCLGFAGVTIANRHAADIFSVSADLLLVAPHVICHSASPTLKTVMCQLIVQAFHVAEDQQPCIAAALACIDEPIALPMVDQLLSKLLLVEPLLLAKAFHRLRIGPSAKRRRLFSGASHGGSRHGASANVLPPTTLTGAFLWLASCTEAPLNLITDLADDLKDVSAAALATAINGHGAPSTLLDSAVTSFPRLIGLAATSILMLAPAGRPTTIATFIPATPTPDNQSISPATHGASTDSLAGTGLAALAFQAFTTVLEVGLKHTAELPAQRRLPTSSASAPVLHDASFRTLFSWAAAASNCLLRLPSSVGLDSSKHVLTQSVLQCLANVQLLAQFDFPPSMAIPVPGLCPKPALLFEHLCSCIPLILQSSKVANRRALCAAIHAACSNAHDPSLASNHLYIALHSLATLVQLTVPASCPPYAEQATLFALSIVPGVVRILLQLFARMEDDGTPALRLFEPVVSLLSHVAATNVEHPMVAATVIRSVCGVICAAAGGTGPVAPLTVRAPGSEAPIASYRSLKRTSHDLDPVAASAPEPLFLPTNVQCDKCAGTDIINNPTFACTVDAGALLNLWWSFRTVLADTSAPEQIAISFLIGSRCALVHGANGTAVSIILDIVAQLVAACGDPRPAVGAAAATALAQSLLAISRHPNLLRSVLAVSRPDDALSTSAVPYAATPSSSRPSELQQARWVDIRHELKALAPMFLSVVALEHAIPNVLTSLQQLAAAALYDVPVSVLDAPVRSLIAFHETYDSTRRALTGSPAASLVAEVLTTLINFWLQFRQKNMWLASAAASEAIHRLGVAFQQCPHVQDLRVGKNQAPCATWDLFLQVQDDVFPLFVPNLAKLKQLDAFCEDIFDGAIQRDILVRASLPSILPTLFASGDTELIGDLSLGVQLEDYEHIIVYRLLCWSGARCATGWNTFRTKFPGSVYDVLDSCWFSLLGLFVVELGRDHRNLLSVFLGIAEIMQGHRRMRPDMDEAEHKGIDLPAGDADLIIALSQRPTDAAAHTAAAPSDKKLLQQLISSYFLFLSNRINSLIRNSTDYGSRNRHNDRPQPEVTGIIGLRSLQRLMDTLGTQYVDQFVTSIMASLKLALSVPSLVTLACETWQDFVKTLSNEVLEEYLAIMVASMMSVIEPVCSDAFLPSEEAKKAAQDVLHLILTTRIASVPKQRLDGLIFYPHPLQDDMTVCETLLSTQPFDKVLRLFGKSMQHESLDVKLWTLRHLQTTLVQHADAFYGHILSESVLPKGTNFLIRQLLRLTATTSNDDLRLLCAKTLGMIGAIDPARMRLAEDDKEDKDSKEERPKSRKDKAAQPEKPDPGKHMGFAELGKVLLIDHLAKGLRAAHNTAIQDRFAWAMQQLLKVLAHHGLGSTESIEDLTSMHDDVSHLPGTVETRGTRAATPDPRSIRHLQQLPDVLVEMLSDDPRCLADARLYWRSNYNNIIRPLDEPPPFYNRYLQSTEKDFDHWISVWARYLVYCSREEFRPLFFAVRGVLRYDVEIARLLLPFLVFDVWDARTPDPKAKEMLVEEMRQVLTDSWVPLSASASARERQRVQDLQHRSAEAVLSLLDRLRAWSIARINNGQPPLKCADELPSKIGLSVLAAASRRCQAFSRALMYEEAHIRKAFGDDSGSLYQPAAAAANVNSRSKAALTPAAGGIFYGGMTIDRDTLRTLQLIYSELEEPDGLNGIAALRARTFKPDDVLVSAGHGAAPGTSSSRDAAIATARHLQEQLIDREQNSEWNEAVVCYEQGLQALGAEQAWQSAVDAGDNTVVVEERALQTGLFRCLRNVGYQETVMQRAFAIMRHRADLAFSVVPFAVEASWRLSRWSALEQVLAFARQCDAVVTNSLLPGEATDRSQSLYEIHLGAGFLALQSRVHDVGSSAGTPSQTVGPDALSAFETAIRDARLDVMAALAAAASESYQRAYPLLMKLHAVSELEQIMHICVLPPGQRTAAWNQLHWDRRMQVVARSYSLREPLFALRRVLFRMFDMSDQEAAVWLSTAKAARLERHYTAATGALLQSAGMRVPVVKLQVAKLLVAQGQLERALEELEPVSIDLQFLLANTPEPQKALRSKELLLATKLLRDANTKVSSELLERYETAVKLDDCGKSYFTLARFLDNMLEADDRSNEIETWKPASSQGLIVRIIDFYGKSIKDSPKHIFQALPRLLTLWLDYSAHAVRASSGQEESERQKRWFKTAAGNGKRSEDIREEINTAITRLVREYPKYYWMTVLTQLMSRVCHRDSTVATLLTKILSQTVEAYSQQALWTVFGLTRSRVEQRKIRANEIMRLAFPSLARAGINVPDAISSLYECLIQVAAAPTDADAARLIVENRAAKWPGLLTMPCQEYLTVSLPDSISDAHMPFKMPETLNYWRTAIVVMSSKERPKKLIARSQLMNERPFLCKQERKGDLRKDARMMEICSMINRLLEKDLETRRRKLRLRTYAVVCLNEECGLLEWVENTLGYRNAVTQVYQLDGGRNPIRTTKQLREQFEALQRQYQQKPDVRAQEYRRRIATHFPAIFHQWFILNAPTPNAWFDGRLAFTRSAAVWSMVGHIIGLGDRHGENILLDSKTCECVHVDFDCLFDKGLLLARPEVVPFRLTPNMLDAMGVSGYEGVFKRVSEITLQLLRNNKDMLMSVLESFIYDPLVEWSKATNTTAVRRKKTGGAAAVSSQNGAESENAEGRITMTRVEQRLAGYYNTTVKAVRDTKPDRSEAPLSVRGQLDRLLHEATCDENLSDMYIGWMPFL